MVKVVYNSRYGGFSISGEAVKYLKEHGVPKKYCNTYTEIPRHDKTLVECVETLRDAANGPFAKLSIAVIEGKKYHIDEHDGFESVKTPENTDWIIVED